VISEVLLLRYAGAADAVLGGSSSEGINTMLLLR
jgi:hypothetical protein